MRMNRLIVCGLSALALSLAGCSNGNWNVKRVDPSASTDVDYRFNDQDAQQVFHAMASDMLSRPWIDESLRENGGKRPVVFLGTIKNNTQDYVNTELFTNQLKAEMINGGRIDVKAEREARQLLRDERLDTKYNDPATVKQAAKELNSDFALVGSVNDNKQRTNDGRTVVNYYQITMELTNVETARIVWSKTEPIKKVATR